ncbi:hypothetical protein MARCHEWKA_04750 [Brevundimonas phage vB_BpoS-Marchewka]|uniref:Uncharacterized protein n=1 Tax=Brevundimonas phage vB_BpoS-Marchewka TaxID=2948604 RepID=A0A9E7SU22_9CAUD|nr:hypothetical protein MARCHEWKA_04750 [Brevundimonas phage vB_BpoS-Marchewka]
MEGFQRGLELIGTGAAGLLVLACLIFGACWCGMKVGGVLEPLATSARARQNAWTATKALAQVLFWIAVILGALAALGCLVELLLGAPLADAVNTLARA